MSGEKHRCRRSALHPPLPAILFITGERDGLALYFAGATLYTLPARKCLLHFLVWTLHLIAFSRQVCRLWGPLFYDAITSPDGSSPRPRTGIPRFNNIIAQTDPFFFRAPFPPSRKTFCTVFPVHRWKSWWNNRRSVPRASNIGRRIQGTLSIRVPFELERSIIWFHFWNVPLDMKIIVLFSLSFFIVRVPLTFYRVSNHSSRERSSWPNGPIRAFLCYNDHRNVFNRSCRFRIPSRFSAKSSFPVSLRCNYITKWTLMFLVGLAGPGLRLR